MPTANRFKSALAGGRGGIGLWANLTDPVALEICASSGFDWVLMDAEHSPADTRSLLSGLQAAAPHPSSILVRPPHGDEVRIKQLLDLGVQSLLIPMVETREHAAQLAAAVQFPPLGVRGVSSQTRAGNWGRNPDYLHGARDEICLILQIESAEGLAHVEEILAVPGIDALFVGTADLAASMGHLGKPGHPEVLEAVDRIVKAAAAAAVPLGTLTRSAEAARGYFEQGFSFVGVGTDTAILASALTTLARSFDPVATSL
jgi:4-hydroxy-2-oxoheptanedioate aldolase